MIQIPMFQIMPKDMLWKISPNVKIQMPNQCQSPNAKRNAAFILDFGFRI